MGAAARFVRSTIGLDSLAGGVAASYSAARARHFMDPRIRISVVCTSYHCY